MYSDSFMCIHIKYAFMPYNKSQIISIPYILYPHLQSLSTQYSLHLESSSLNALSCTIDSRKIFKKANCEDYALDFKLNSYTADI